MADELGAGKAKQGLVDRLYREDVGERELTLDVNNEGFGTFQCSHKLGCGSDGDLRTPFATGRSSRKRGKAYGLARQCRRSGMAVVGRLLIVRRVVGVRQNGFIGPCRRRGASHHSQYQQGEDVGGAVSATCM